MDLDANQNYKIVLTDEDLEELIHNDLSCKKLYLGYDVLIDTSILEILNNKGIELIRIPDFYYSDLK